VMAVREAEPFAIKAEPNAATVEAGGKLGAGGGVVQGLFRQERQNAV